MLLSATEYIQNHRLFLATSVRDWQAWFRHFNFFFLLWPRNDWSRPFSLLSRWNEVILSHRKMVTFVLCLPLLFSLNVLVAGDVKRVANFVRSVIAAEIYGRVALWALIVQADLSFSKPPFNHREIEFSGSTSALPWVTPLWSDGLYYWANL